MRSIVLVSLFFGASACARSHEHTPRDDAGLDPSDAASLDRCEGSPFPSSLHGVFALHPFECRASMRAEPVGWRLSIAADGQVWLGVPDGPEARGRFACESGAWAFRSETGGMAPLAFVVRASTDPRVDFALESLESAPAWRAWAVRVDDSVRAEGVRLPSGVACARRARWSLRPIGGDEVWAEGTDEPTERRAQWRFGAIDAGSGADWVSLWDPALGRALGGTAIVWDGRRGIARASRDALVCAADDDTLTFGRRGEVWTVGVRWRVPDVDDRDHDGDREDEMVRETEYELTNDDCR